MEAPRLEEPSVGAQEAPGVRLREGNYPRPLDANPALQQIDSIVSEEKGRADQLAVLDADQKLASLSTSLLYDPKNGAINKLGKDSFGTPDQVNQDFKKGADDIASSLSNRDQQATFMHMYRRRQNELNSAIQHHVSQQIKVYDNETTNAHVKTEEDAAALNWFDPMRVEMAVASQRAVVSDWAKRNGIPAAAKGEPDGPLEMRVKDAVSKTRSGVVNQMLAAGQDQTAKQFFADHREDFNSDDTLKLTHSLEEGTLRGEGQRKTDEITAKTTDRGEALDMARDVADPKLRDEVTERVNKRFNDIKVAEKEKQESVYSESANALDKAPAGTNPRDLISPAKWTAMSPAQQNALYNRATDPPNNDKAYLDFISKSPVELSRMTRTEFESDYWAQFDQVHRTRAEAMWKSASEGGIADPKLTATISFERRVEDTMRSSGLIPANRELHKLSTDDRAMYSQFEIEASRRIEQYEMSDLKGTKKASGDEIQSIIDGMVKDRVFMNKVDTANRAWFSGKAPKAILTDKERGMAYVPMASIPESNRNEIANMMQKQQRRVNSDKVQRAYAAYLMDDRTRFNAIIGE